VHRLIGSPNDPNNNIAERAPRERRESAERASRERRESVERVGAIWRGGGAGEPREAHAAKECIVRLMFIPPVWVSPRWRHYIPLVPMHGRFLVPGLIRPKYRPDHPTILLRMKDVRRSSGARVGGR
jgi:hypothetical protein